MVPYLLDLNEKQISETALTTAENYYCTSIVTFIGYSWNSQGVFLYPIFLEHYFRILPGVSLGIFSEYAGKVSRECSTNIPRTYICLVGKKCKICKETVNTKSKVIEYKEKFSLKKLTTEFYQKKNLHGFFL